MDKYDWLLFGLIVSVYLSDLYKATTLPEEEAQLKRKTVCKGDIIRQSCISGNVIAVQSVQYGTKLATECPDVNNPSPECCFYDSGDCFFPDYTDTAQQAACSGKNLCEDVTVAQAGGCDASYPSLNHYLTMTFYCIPESRIKSMCTSVTETNILSPIYLKNQDYPIKIRGADDSCSCSVESTTCSSRINVYLIHLELADGGGSCTGTQKIIIDDAGTTHRLTCSDNNDYAITLKLTSSTNYITVTLENQDRVNDGYLWIGFEATDSASFRMDCPAKLQENCKDCGSLANPSDGNVTMPAGSGYLAEATYSCNTGYTLEGSATRQCQIDSTWSNAEPNCNINDCGSLDAPTNGSVTFSSGTTYQSVATFSCDTGYTLDGVQTRSCEASKSWSNTSPICNINDCGSLDAPTNGSVTFSSGTTYQSVAAFSCDTGYTLDGAQTRTCEASKSWSNTSPICNINNCGGLDAPTSGSVTFSSGTTYQSVATFRCDTGYTLDGDETRTCEASKSWSNTSPICDINDCGTITAPDHGTIQYSSGTVYQSVSTYSCDVGYSVVGVVRRECQANSSWSDSDSTCVVNDCGDLTDPDNGYVLYSNPPNSLLTATYHCNIGYTLNGTESRQCPASGIWSNNALGCDINDCGFFNDPPNGDVAFPNGTTYQSVAVLTCKTNYTLFGQSTRECQANSSWTDTDAECYLDCGALETPRNGSVETSNGFIYKSVANFSCDSGYTLLGKSTIICQNTGQWSDDSPTCQINDCGDLTAPENGTISYSSGTTYQSVATFSCDTGYTRDGDDARTCQANEEWSNTSPDCVINDCGDLTVPTNGIVTYSSGTTYQSVATFSCDTGYTLDGDETRTCQASKTWSNNDPVCRINDCGDLTEPENGTISFSSGTTYQSVATFSCDTGYTRDGDETRTCQANEEWSNTSPVCNINNCGDLPTPKNGKIFFSSGTTYQSVATFSCDTGYTRDGDETQTCQANKEWSNTSPVCKVNDCGTLQSPVDGTVTYSSTTYMSEATYSCESNFTLTGVKVRKCQADGSWNGTAPTCRAPDTPPTTRKPRTIDTDIHSTITIAVVVTIGIIVFAGSLLAVFVRTQTFQSMIKPQHNTHGGIQSSRQYQNMNGRFWQRNTLNSLPNNGYSSSAYSFYYGQNGR